MKYTAFATNEKTGDYVELGSFATPEEAWWNIHYNLVWDEGENPDDFTFQVIETKGEVEGGEWGYNEDCGFDPYLGCYTGDC